jgi:hypothetical protein
LWSSTSSDEEINPKWRREILSNRPFLTKRKLKSPLDKRKYTTNDAERNPPHIVILCVWLLKVFARSLIIEAGSGKRFSLTYSPSLSVVKRPVCNTYFFVSSIFAFISEGLK